MLRGFVRQSWLAAVFVCGVSAQQYTITTFAGNGTAGYAGDAGAATAAQLNGPSGVAVDPKGRLVIVDAGNERLRLVSGGTITSVAGNGNIEYTGDGGQATAAQLYSPARATVGSDGTIYFSDSGSNIIRMITPDGIISTIAGIGCTDTLYTGCGPGYTGDGGPATLAMLNNPLGLAVDGAGNLYIADASNNVIRKISGGNISTVPVLFKLNHPDDVALDSAGNLYIADTNNDRIIKYSSTGASSLFAGTSSTGFSGDGGPANQAKLSSPVAVTVDQAGTVYIADTFNGRIRKVTNGMITTIAGNGQPSYSGDGGPALNAALYFPRAIAVDLLGNVYVADSGNNRIRELIPPAAVISANGVVNAASFAAQISPGALATVFGNFFGAAIQAGTVPLPSSLNTVSVSVAGRNAPLLYLTPTQVNFQVPWETPVGTANVTVSVNGTVSNTVNVQVLSAGPGLFTVSGAAIVQNADFSLNGPSNPAARGSAIVAYLTGSGPLIRTPADGAPSPTSPLAQASSTVTATIGSQAAPVLFAGLTPGFVGLVQVNLTVPATLSAGTYPLTITINGDASNSGTVTTN